MGGQGQVNTYTVGEQFKNIADSFIAQSYQVLHRMNVCSVDMFCCRSALKCLMKEEISSTKEEASFQEGWRLPMLPLAIRMHARLGMSCAGTREVMGR